ncbi:hypothetical protein C8Q72DRAFT_955599 [Fomitopsis betulina]|nr:hypothetical protein C8Q72DRAFT_955599 [Fomitopsis betulina]
MDVIPAYDQLQQDFKVMEDDMTLAPVCCVTAHAAVLMTHKYYSRLDNCEAYFIAIVMCPDRKLQWFFDNDWSLEDIVQIRDIVMQRFYEKFKPPPQTAQNTSTVGPPAGSTPPIGIERWHRQQLTHTNP